MQKGKHRRRYGWVVILLIIIGVLFAQNWYLMSTKQSTMRDLVVNRMLYADNEENEEQGNDRSIKREHLIQEAEDLLSSNEPDGYISTAGADAKDYLNYYSEEWVYGKLKYAPMEPYYKGISLLSFNKLCSEEWGLWLQGSLLKEFEEVSETNRQYVEEALKETTIEEGDSDNEKVEKLLTYLSENTEYKAEDSTIKGLCVNKSANCSAYAEFFYDACLILDIPCQIIIGDAVRDTGETELHAWNKIYSKENKIWYYVDPCWADGGDSVNEKYSLSAALWEDHTIEKTLQ